MTVVASSLREHVTAIVARQLGVPAADLDPHSPFALYGLDSISAMELVATIEDAIDRALPDWMLVEHPTLHDLLTALDGGASERDGLVDLIARDAQLPRDIVVPPEVDVVSPPRTVLLTGATGLLGAHLLRTLVDDTRAHILCLVRAEPGEGLARVRANLEGHQLWTDDIAPRIEVVRGDLARPRLGLDAAAFESCADAVDTIYHAAADVDWVQPYVSLRQINVAGTIDLIRLAATSRPKTLVFVSSISSCYAPDVNLCCDEATDALGWAASLPLGYAQTKAVCEALLRQAAARGVPVHVVRPSLLSGDARTGIAASDDLIARAIKGCLQMGIAPDLDWDFDAVPVDHAARAIVRLAHARAGAPTLHLVNPQPRSWQECVLWMRMRGYDCRLVPFDEWVERLDADAASPSHPLAGLRAFFHAGRSGRASSAAERLQRHRHAPVSSDRSQALLRDRGLVSPPISGELLGRYFDGWIRDGFLEEPGRVDCDGRVTLDGRLSGDGQSRVHRDRTVHRDPLVHRWTDLSVINSMVGSGPRVVLVEALESGSKHSIISELTSWRGGPETGLFALRLHRDEGAPPLDVMLKAKPRDEDAIDVAVALAQICDAKLGDIVAAHREELGLRGGHLREIDLYTHAPAALRAILPACHGTLRDDDAGRFAVMLERLTDVELLDSADTPELWTPAHLDAAIAGLAVIQETTPGVVSRLGVRKRHPVSFFSALAAHAAPRVAAWAGADVAALQTRLAAAPEAWRPALDASPQVLVHNDFNPRNLATRRGAPDGAPRLVAYDWELMTLGAPQQDIAELLCFVLPPDVDARTVDAWIDRAHAALGATPAGRVDAAAWRRGVHAALAQLLVDRFAFYTLIDRVRRQNFLPRVVATCARLLALTRTCSASVRGYDRYAWYAGPRNVLSRAFFYSTGP